MKIHQDIETVIRTFDFTSGTTYTLNGLHRDIERIQIKDPAYALGGESISIKQKFIDVLTTDIYNNLYNACATDVKKTSIYKGDTFIKDLSQANTGTGIWETGWQFLKKEHETGKTIVQKNGLNFWVEKSDIRLSDDMSCMVKTAKECQCMNAHFYYAYGNTDKTMLDKYDGQVLRFYWNICSAVAIPYIHAITTFFNERKILFTTKVLSNPADYTRSDAAVLYIDRSQLDDVLRLLPAIYERIESGINPTVPLFVKQLLPGLGFAEDMSNGLSFGISRSKLIAEALYDCVQEEISDHALWKENLDKKFKQAGIEAAYPFAQACHAKQYELIINQYSRSWN